MKSGAATMVKAMFLAAALLSTGCSGNSLMGPASSTDTQTTQTANAGANQSGQGQKP
jgi:hypothetical protein